MKTTTEENETIKQKLSELESHIDDYRTSLNTEGIWLFLATLGCWSVNHDFSQAFALMITFILFSYRIYSKASFRVSFSTNIKTLEDQIKTQITQEDTQKARLHDLQQIQSKKLSTFQHIKQTAIFLMCYSFWGITAYHWARLNG